MEAGKDAEGQVGHTLEAVARSLEFILRRQGITEELEDYKHGYCLELKIPKRN